MILTLNFQGQIWNLLYLSQKWCDCHKTKTEHIGRTLGLKCHHRVWPWPWPWPWSFKVNYGICYISTKSGPKVRCKDLPDSDWGDFRCRRAIDSSSFILYCPSLSSSGHERKVLDNPHCVHTHGHSVYHTMLLRLYYVVRATGSAAPPSRPHLLHKTFHLPSAVCPAFIAIGGATDNLLPHNHMQETMCKIRRWIALKGQYQIPLFQNRDRLPKYRDSQD